MTPSGTSPYVLAFAEWMEDKLAANRHKGDREGWTKLSKFALIERLAEEVLELNQSIHTGTAQEIASECADVANYAMMIADVVGGLKPTFPPKDAGWTLDPDEVDPPRARAEEEEVR